MPRPAIHPGEILGDELAELGVSPTELARQLGVPANRITRIVKGRCAITGDTALRLGHWFKTGAQYWLNLQTAYDLRLAAQLAGRTIEKLPTRKPTRARKGGVTAPTWVDTGTANIFRFVRSARTNIPFADDCGARWRRQGGSRKIGAMTELLSRITIRPEQCHGRPCIRGMRIRVSDILEMLAAGSSKEEILADFPDLEPDDIRACLAYAANLAGHPVVVAAE